MDASKAGDLIFRGVYSYRKPQVAVMGSLCISLFGPVFGLFFLDLFKPHAGSEIALGIGLCIFTGMFLVIGIMLVYHFIADHKKELTIDLTGVTYGHRFYPWTCIATVTKSPKSPERQLMVLKTGFMPLNRLIWIDGGLSSNQYSKLMRDLSRLITPLHPHTYFK
jgi:hypothetical protein